jgi:hypothetical protein
MPHVLLVDPALGPTIPGLRALLPEAAAIDIVTSFDDEELARLAADALVLVNSRRTVDSVTFALIERLPLSETLTRAGRFAPGEAANIIRFLNGEPVVDAVRGLRPLLDESFSPASTASDLERIDEMQPASKVG